MKPEINIKQLLIGANRLMTRRRTRLALVIALLMIWLAGQQSVLQRKTLFLLGNCWISWLRVKPIWMLMSTMI